MNGRQDSLLELLQDSLEEQLMDAADDLARGYGWDGMSELMREAAREIVRLEGCIGEAYWQGRDDEKVDNNGGGR